VELFSWNIESETTILHKKGKVDISTKKLQKSYFGSEVFGHFWGRQWENTMFKTSPLSLAKVNRTIFANHFQLHKKKVFPPFLVCLPQSIWRIEFAKHFTNSRVISKNIDFFLLIFPNKNFTKKLHYS